MTIYSSEVRSIVSKCYFVIIAVSYTHLDVYKRQVFDKIRNKNIEKIPVLQKCANIIIVEIVLRVSFYYVEW